MMLANVMDQGKSAWEHAIPNCRPENQARWEGKEDSKERIMTLMTEKHLQSQHVYSCGSAGKVCHLKAREKKGDI